MRNIERSVAQEVTQEIKAAIAPILAKHNLEQTKISATYGDQYALRITATAVDLDENGINRADPMVAAYERHAKFFGLPEDGVGRTFVAHGSEYVILGLAVSRTKYPLAAKRVEDGRKSFFPEGPVVAYFARQRALAQAALTGPAKS